MRYMIWDIHIRTTDSFETCGRLPLVAWAMCGGRQAIVVLQSSADNFLNWRVCYQSANAMETLSLRFESKFVHIDFAFNQFKSQIKHA